MDNFIYLSAVEHLEQRLRYRIPGDDRRDPRVRLLFPYAGALAVATLHADHRVRGVPLPTAPLALPATPTDVLIWALIEPGASLIPPHQARPSAYRNRLHRDSNTRLIMHGLDPEVEHRLALGIDELNRMNELLGTAGLGTGAVGSTLIESIVARLSPTASPSDQRALATIRCKIRGWDATTLAPIGRLCSSLSAAIERSRR